MSSKSISTITKKEFLSYFFSPVGFIVITIYLLVSGWFLFSTIFLAKSVTLRDFFQLMPPILAFIIPALTMKSYSEEFKTGSIEILGTQPVKDMEVAIGKFLATWLFVLVMLLPTLSYPITLSTLGDLDGGVVFSGYIGAILLSGAFTALGILASTFTHNQIIAFIIGAVICFFLTIIDGMVILLPKFIASIVQYISTGYHFENISKGILDSRDIIYFLSIIFIGVFITGRRVHK